MLLKLYNWILIYPFIFLLIMYLNRTQKLDSLCLSILHSLKDGAVKHSKKSIRRPWERVNSVCKQNWTLGCFEISHAHITALWAPFTSLWHLLLNRQYRTNPTLKHWNAHFCSTALWTCLGHASHYK